MTVLPKRSSQNRLRFGVDRFHCRAHLVQAARPIDQPDEDRRAPSGQELAQRTPSIARRAGCFLKPQGLLAPKVIELTVPLGSAKFSCGSHEIIQLPEPSSVFILDDPLSCIEEFI